MQMVRTADANGKAGSEVTGKAGEGAPRCLKGGRILKRKRDDTFDEEALKIFNTTSNKECERAGEKTATTRSTEGEDTAVDSDYVGKRKKDEIKKEEKYPERMGVVKRRKKVPRNERQVHQENVNSSFMSSRKIKSVGMM